jgi:hypothetical protein
VDQTLDTKSRRFTAVSGGALGAVFAIVLSILVSAFGLVSGYIAYSIGFIVFFCILVLVLRRVSKNVTAENLGRDWLLVKNEQVFNSRLQDPRHSVG